MDFRHVKLFGPVVCPVKLSWRRSHLLYFTTNEDAVDQGSEQHQETEYQHAKADVPHEGRVVQLQHHHEAEGDEEEAQVQQHHQAAHALGVGAARVGRRHGLHHQLPSSGGLRLDADDVAPAAAPAAPAAVRVVADLRLRARHPSRRVDLRGRPRRRPPLLLIQLRVDHGLVPDGELALGSVARGSVLLDARVVVHPSAPGIPLPGGVPGPAAFSSVPLPTGRSLGRVLVAGDRRRAVSTVARLRVIHIPGRGTRPFEAHCGLWLCGLGGLGGFFWTWIS